MRNLGPNKICPMCFVSKPRDRAHWFIRMRNGKPLLDAYCKECRTSYNYSRRDPHAIKQGYAGEHNRTPERALAAFREGILSTKRFFEILLQSNSQEKALEIVNQERKAHGLPAMSL